MMRNPKIPVKTLRIEPYLIPGDQLTDYEGPPEGMLAYRMFANKRQIAKAAHPLRATDALVARQINRDMPWFEYSGAYWQVRRIHHHVLWFGEAIAYHFVWKPQDKGVGGRWLKIFDETQYQQALDAAYEAHQDAWQHVIYPDDYETPVQLPELCSSEVCSLFCDYVPLPVDVEPILMAREPTHPDDPRGIRLYRKLSNALRDHRHLELCDPPEKITKLTLYFHNPRYMAGSVYEWVWLLGLTEQGVAMRIYKQNRSFDFPFWVRGEALDLAFANETFFR